MTHPADGETSLIRHSVLRTGASQGRPLYICLLRQAASKSALVSEKKSSNTFDLEGAVDYLMNPVSGNNAKNRQVHGALSLHVDDLLMTGDDVFEKEIMGRLRKDFQVGSEDKNDCLFVGQRIQWKQDDKHGWYVNVHQNVAIDELQEITFDKYLKDDTPLTPQMHAAYRSVLGQIN